MVAAPAYYDDLEEEEELPDDINYVWSPEDEVTEDPIVIQQAVSKIHTDLPRIRPSSFTEFAFMMPTEVGEGDNQTIELRNFSFKERPHLRRIYDTGARRIILMCARQVEKSTLLGNISLSYSCIVPGYRTLYVSPSATQTKTFSADRVKEPLETSVVLRQFTTKMLSQNVFEKQFVNRSKITLRYAFLNADRCRGIPAWGLMLDEIQDILTDNIPVIEACQNHAPKRWRRNLYSGTPKSLDNTIETYWSSLSTQNEWVVPCDGCNTWNILGEKNIGRKGLICAKCGKLIRPQHERAQWAAQREFDEVKVPFEGYRISQLMVPWVDWTEILISYENAGRDKFYNEVLGISYDSGMRPLTKAQLQAVSNPQISMVQSELDKYRAIGAGQPIFAGIDWGSGEHSYTVLTLATYIQRKFRVFYMHRFTGDEVEPDRQMDLIIEMLRYMSVDLIGTDYGGGLFPNDRLIRVFGRNRVWKYQYVSNPRFHVKWNKELARYMIHRTEVMSNVFNAIKRGRECEFPCWEEFEKPFAQDMLNIFSEPNKMLRMIQYKHAVDKPDDSFHSFLYAWLVSMIRFPRPDIIRPNKENDQGIQIPAYQGNTYQG
jgi:phage terminase large subunit GpA